MTKKGKVFLVGAGPGDEELLTLKAEKLIKNAQVVVFDKLVSETIMNMIPKTAIKINVGKNVGDHPVPQNEINEIICNKAKEGYEVIRLKGGDSFLFGRGGEELELLVKNKIEFEVVPGITSAMAVATYAGIPVTHRDYSSSLHIITGHKKMNGTLNLDYDALVRLDGTLIFMMSVASMGEIAQGLIANGMSETMDCAVVENGTRPSQRKFITNIGSIKDIIEQNKVESPALIIVGKVCRLANDFDWFSKLPLFGTKILVTRPTDKSSGLALSLKQKGSEVIELPSIKTIKLEFEFPNINDYNAVIFTSPTGVETFFDSLFKNGYDSRKFSGKKVIVVGKETRKALLKYGIVADFIPKIYSSRELAIEIIAKSLIQKTDKILIARAKESSKDLTNILSANEINFDEILIYETQYNKYESLNINDFDFVTFTSASCVKGFVMSIGGNKDFSKVKAICIGEQTAFEASKYNMEINISDTATINSMVECIEEINNVK